MAWNFFLDSSTYFKLPEDEQRSGCHFYHHINKKVTKFRKKEKAKKQTQNTKAWRKIWPNLSSDIIITSKVVVYISCWGNVMHTQKWNMLKLLMFLGGNGRKDWWEFWPVQASCKHSWPLLQCIPFSDPKLDKNHYFLLHC